ncbi:hypothetical protein BST63_16905 [Bradyrhizobium canariense]|uniref:Uncharacterized protein n=1 Tax=Bradyrhizobium canariense TaxID=255045 RepID=A0ABX3X2I2_9BRAD|nr:hypothetical protein BSR47_18910 [Bradyrhizobium canariense]OSJ28415.1 hypothetical protein BST63_16905 [Bradyrhizobium canariense]
MIMPQADDSALFARQFTLAGPQFSEREQIVILIYLRLFQKRVFISGTPRSKSASVVGLETTPAAVGAGRMGRGRSASPKEKASKTASRAAMLGSYGCQQQPH